MFSLKILPNEIATIPFPFIVDQGLFIISKNKILHIPVSRQLTLQCALNKTKVNPDIVTCNFISEIKQALLNQYRRDTGRVGERILV